VTGGRHRDGDARELAVVDEVLAELRHDVRNKLSAVGQAAEYLRRKVEPTDLWRTEKRVPRFFSVIEDQLAIIDRMLEAEAITRKVHARAPVVADPVQIVAAATRGARLGDAALETSIQPGPVWGDVAEISLAVRHLLENAADATPPGGAVRLVGAPRSPPAYVFTIEDEGPGLSSAEFQRLVRPFASTREERRGLGLSIARRIAHRWGGDLHLAMSAKGASFELVLAAARPEIP
jgi:signal transduction histidine kinase